MLSAKLLSRVVVITSISCAYGVAMQAPGTTANDGAVTVDGNHLMKNGNQWIPHGLNLIAFVQPPAAQPGGCDGKTSTVFQTAWNRYQAEGSALFTDLLTWGADSVRFQVAQEGLDPQSTLYSETFAETFIQAVQAARSAGLNVVVSLQDECQSGDPQTARYPNAKSRRVWASLAPVFKNDTGILFEIYNEPEPPANARTWQIWQSRFNDAIATIRAAGATNVVIADGLAFGTTLEGAPLLTDPANQVAYAVHPYFHRSGLTDGFWDERFGNLAASQPVLVTEWTTVANAAQSGSSYYCDANTPLQAVSLMQYLQRHAIGMLGFAWDFTGSIFGSVVYYSDAKTPAYTDSTFSGATCGSSGFGPGKTMQTWFQTGNVPASPL